MFAKSKREKTKRAQVYIRVEEQQRKHNPTPFKEKASHRLKKKMGEKRKEK